MAKRDECYTRFTNTQRFGATGCRSWEGKDGDIQRREIIPVAATADFDVIRHRAKEHEGSLGYGGDRFGGLARLDAVLAGMPHLEPAASRDRRRGRHLVISAAIHIICFKTALKRRATLCNTTRCPLFTLEQATSLATWDLVRPRGLEPCL